MVWLERLEQRSLLTLTPIPAAVNFTAGVVSPTTIVGYFLDDDPTAVPVDFKVSISWSGTGPTTAGNVSIIPSTIGMTPELFSVSGSNLYSSPGTDAISISVTGFKPGDMTTISSTAYVGAPVLTPIPTTIGFVAGVLPTTPPTVGSFLDFTSGATASNFVASITWGDGHTSAGTVTESAPGSGLFSVTGNNLYTTAATYPVSIAVTDNLGNSTTIDSTAIVTSSVLSPIPTSIGFIAGVLPATPPTVGSFLDFTAGATASNFVATITWGDGHTSAGTVTESSPGSGLFSVTGNNLYAAANTYMVSIAVKDNLGNSTTINSTAIVTSSVLTPIPTSIGFVAGVLPATPPTVGSFLDFTAGATASNFIATINWGDGHISAGTVTESAPGSGLFSITGNNLYTTANTYMVSIVVRDNLGNSTTIISTADVTSSVLTPIPASIGFVAGVLPTTPPTVGSFLDFTAGATASNFVATITWGDGHISAGTVSESSPGSGLFSITGNNLYATAGTYAVSIAVKDNLGNSTTIDSTAIVTSSVLTPIPTSIGFVAGVLPATPPTVGSFLDFTAGATASNFVATITWGNGHISAGTVSESSPGSGLFSITGNNLYATAGTYAVSIAVKDNLGNSTTINSTAIVTGSVLIPIPTTVDFTSGIQPPSPVVVGSFLDFTSGAVASNFVATISWGDGHTSPGTITESATGSGLFSVTGTNLYALPNTTHTISIVVNDNLGDSTTINSTAIVTGSVLTPVPLLVDFTAGVLPSSPVTVGFFTDFAAGAVASNFIASIMWGDGNSSTGTVTESSTGSGLFSVSGTHIYVAPGTYRLTIVVQDNLGNSTTINSTATVAGSVLTPIPTTVSLTAGVPPSSTLTVGSFFDSNAGTVQGDFTASIAWGDNQITPGTVTESVTSPGLFLVTGTKIYSAPGNYTIVISVSDSKGNSTQITSTATVVTNVVTTPANFGFSAVLDPNTNNGPYASMGFTKTNRPTFSGTAVPFSIVQLYGRYWGVDAVQPLGEAVTNANGQWVLPVGPLATGTYTITATITPPGSYPIAAISATLVNNGVVYIEMTPKTVKVSKHTAARLAAAQKAALRHEALKVHKLAVTHRAKHKG
jgi:hypothetical protein